jgi:hypothetical protein
VDMAGVIDVVPVAVPVAVSFAELFGEPAIIVRQPRSQELH